MKSRFIVLFVLQLTIQHLCAQLPVNASQEKTIIALSAKKWTWMADKQADSLRVLFDEKSNFVHMGGTWGKDREVEIIQSGFIWYKKAEVLKA